MKVNLKKNIKGGFTLIELLIVIAIIGILAVALLPSILSAPASARDAAKQAAMGQVAVALEQYNASAGSYPDAVGGGGECMVNNAAVALGAQTKLQPYFKSGDIPKLDGAILRANATPADVTSVQMTSTCNGILYCKLLGNRYYLGVVMESPAVSGKGRYSIGAAFTGCAAGTVAAPAMITTAATSVYGILN